MKTSTLAILAIVAYFMYKKEKQQKTVSGVNYAEAIPSSKPVAGAWDFLSPNSPNIKNAIAYPTSKMK